MTRQRFYVQREPRDVWHVESEDDPELMLCGATISIAAPEARVQHRFGLKPCLWCKRLLDERDDSSSPRSSASYSRSGSLMLPPGSRTVLRDVTTRTGTTT